MKPISPKYAIVYTILILVMVSCGSFDPNANIEIAEFPPQNNEGIAVKDHIKKSLKTMYPNIGKFKLENELDGHKALFHMGGSYFKVSFDSKGNWKKSKVDIRFTKSINEEVREAIKNTDFKDWKIIEKELEEKIDEIEYKFTFQKNQDYYQLKFNGDGLLVKKEKSTIQFVN
jgi:hypothetical protein